MTEKKDDCYIDVWREADFRGEAMRIYGPVEYASLDFAEGNWGDDIGSLRVGPNAFILAYHRPNFQDRLITFGPNDEVADLSQFEFDDEIESMKVIDSFKIFNHLDYNAAHVPEDAPETPDAQPVPDSNKSRQWKSKRR